MTPSTKSLIVRLIQQTQDDNRDVIDTMPDVASSPGQHALQSLHGTPKEFAKACISAIGEISPLEAHAAISKYLQEWNRA